MDIEKQQQYNKIKNSIHRTKKIVKNTIEENYHDIKVQLKLKTRGHKIDINDYMTCSQEDIYSNNKDSFSHGTVITCREEICISSSTIPAGSFQFISSIKLNTARDENEAMLRLPKNNIQCQQAKEQRLQGS